MSEATAGDIFEMTGDFRQSTIYIKSEVQGSRIIRTPFQRPPRAEHFVDRQRELAEILENLQPGRVVTICGPGGIGKSALAAEAVWTLTPDDTLPERFPHGVIYYSFYGQPKVALSLEHIVRSFDEEARDISPGAVRRLLSGTHALLILDGTEEADDLWTLLETRGNCGVLITSRSRKDSIASRWDLQPLELDEAVQLLQAWGKGRTTDEPVARSICEEVGRLPLAVRLVGRYLDQTEEPGTEYLEWLRETPIQALSYGEHRGESIDLLLNQSLEQVGKHARDMLAAIGLLALAPFPVEPLASAMGLMTRAAIRSLGELVSYGLLLRSRDTYEVSHALVHTYSQRWLTAPDLALQRLGDYFIRFARECQHKGKRRYDQMDRLRPHLMAVLTRLVDRSMWETVIDLTHEVTRSRQEGYLQVRGYWNEEEDSLNEAIDAAQRLVEEADTKSRAYWVNQLATLKSGLGDLCMHRDQYDEALAVFSEVQQLYEPPEDHRLEIARLMLQVGEIHLRKRRLDQALICFEDSLRLCRSIDESDEVLASTYSSLGRVHHLQENYEEAQFSYEESLVCYPNSGYEAERALVLIRLGTLAFDRLEEETAWEYLEQSEILVNRSGGRSRFAAHVRRELANQYLWRWNYGRAGSNFRKAEQLLVQSLQDFESLGDKENTAWSLQNLGDTFFEKEYYQEAKENYQKAEGFYFQALECFEELGISSGQGYALDHLGQIRLKWKKLGDARECFMKALEAFRESGSQSGPGWIFLNMGDLEHAEGNLEAATQYYEKSLQVWKRIGNRRRILLAQERLRSVGRRV